MIEQITLEMSLKPFKKTDDEYVLSVCEKMFTQWKPLLSEAETISIMLWTADGSEILDYRGRLSDEFEWCYHIGGANNKLKWNKRFDPEKKGLHARSYLYMDNPPYMNYEILKKIIKSIRCAAEKILGNIPIEIGETFDPGPEFAISPFKYERHNEICVSNDMGEKGMVYAMGVLKEDNISYAGYPHGIPEGTPFAEFFGRQCRIFLEDMGFDYIWLSNGFGFGRDTWNCCGAVFDGSDFNMSYFGEALSDVISFWKLFRLECPEGLIRTRGTNMSMGIDFATDGVPLREIYNGGFNLLPPPNSPWAAIDDDFGLELMGYMSRIAKLPDYRFMLRYYLHDPWWVNTPWYDRYGGWAHDIYLPFSISRINENGDICNPTHFNILSIDNSMGDMPESCVIEPLPHLKKAIKDFSDAPAPVVWVYPFEEYSDKKTKTEIMKMYSEDWYIRGAINNGFPISTVTSTDYFIGHNKNLYKASVIITPVPQGGSRFEREILAYGKAGGKIIFYGNPINGEKTFLNAMGLCETESIEGELPVTVDGVDCGIIKHNSAVSGGALSVKGEGFAYAGESVIGVNKGSMMWIRGTVSCDYVKGEPLLKPHDENKYFISEKLMLRALEGLGYSLFFNKPHSTAKTPVLSISRSNGAYLFSAYNKTGAVITNLKFPQGAPILIGYGTLINNGWAQYCFPKAAHSECRVFVEQNEGFVSAEEYSPVSHEFRRRIKISGLEDATVRIIGEAYCKNNMTVVLNSGGDLFVGEDYKGQYKLINGETYFEMENITGSIMISMPNKKTV